MKTIEVEEGTQNTRRTNGNSQRRDPDIDLPGNAQRENCFQTAKDLNKQKGLKKKL